MGLRSRRKHSKNAGTRTSFTWNDVWEMIAYLDYCLMLSPDHKRFKNTVATHLEEHTRKSFTFEQVDRKIRKIWNAEGIQNVRQYDHESIYHHGSKVLRFVQNEPEVKDKIQRRVEEIQKEKVWDYMKSDGRTRRSKTIKHHIVLDHDFSFVERTPSPKKVFSQIPTHRHGDKNANEAKQLEVSLTISFPHMVDLTLPQIPTSMDGMSDSPASFRRSTTSPTMSGDEILQTPGTETPSTESEDDDMPTSSFYVPAIKQESGRSSSIAARSFTQFELSPVPSCRVENGTLLDEHTLRECQSQIAKLQRENAWHREEVDRLNKVIADLDTRLAAAMVSKFGDDLTLRRLVDYQSEVQRLKSIINSKEIFKPFTKPGQTHLNKQERADIERNMELIEKDIRSVFIFSGNMGSCCEGGSANTVEDLSLLWQRALGFSGVLIPPVPLQFALRSLLSAAICMWVFEPDFDDTYLANSHSRETMLSHLRTYGEDLML